VDIVTFIADKGKRDVGPTLHSGGLVLPLRGAKLEDVVVDVEGKGNVEIVRANRRVGALCLGSFEVEEADLVPEQGTDVTLKRGKAVGGRVREAVDTYALS
jgi:hypothetical protein